MRWREAVEDGREMLLVNLFAISSLALRLSLRLPLTALYGIDTTTTVNYIYPSKQTGYTKIDDQGNTERDHTLKVSAVSRIFSRAVLSVGHSNPTHSSVAAVVINPTIPISSAHTRETQISAKRGGGREVIERERGVETDLHPQH